MKQRGFYTLVLPHRKIYLNQWKEGRGAWLTMSTFNIVIRKFSSNMNTMSLKIFPYHNGIYERNRNMRGCILEFNLEVLGWQSTVCSFAILLTLNWASRYSLKRRSKKIRGNWFWNKVLRQQFKLVLEVEKNSKLSIWRFWLFGTLKHSNQRHFSWNKKYYTACRFFVIPLRQAKDEELFEILD